MSILPAYGVAFVEDGTQWYSLFEKFIPPNEYDTLNRLIPPYYEPLKIIVFKSINLLISEIKYGHLFVPLVVGLHAEDCSDVTKDTILSLKAIVSSIQIIIFTSDKISQESVSLIQDSLTRDFVTVISKNSDISLTRRIAALLAIAFETNDREAIDLYYKTMLKLEHPDISLVCGNKYSPTRMVAEMMRGSEQGKRFITHWMEMEETPTEKPFTRADAQRMFGDFWQQQNNT